jgi:hypothetical protein
MSNEYSNKQLLILRRRGERICWAGFLVIIIGLVLLFVWFGKLSNNPFLFINILGAVFFSMLGLAIWAIGRGVSQSSSRLGGWRGRFLKIEELDQAWTTTLLIFENPEDAEKGFNILRTFSLSHPPSFLMRIDLAWLFDNKEKGEECIVAIHIPVTASGKTGPMSMDNFMNGWQSSSEFNHMPSFREEQDQGVRYFSCLGGVGASFHPQ